MRDLTVLWALRSPCNLGCRYCYFGTIEEHRAQTPSDPGVLSHLSRDDASLADIQHFLSTVADSSIKRVFLAGGEPLIWPSIFDVIEPLKTAGIEVVIATNGLPLNRPHIVASLLDLDVDAVSVSLDSNDPDYNDHYRPARNRRDGWAQVVTGIRALLSARESALSPRVGMYTVITRRNIDAITEVAALAAQLGLDYFVPQPIALDDDHELHTELSLRDEDLPALRTTLAQLYSTTSRVDVPDLSYVDQFAASVSTPPTQTVRGCFGGDTLAFIEPDGSVWDCPSSFKIAATPEHRRRSILDHHAAELFPHQRTSCPSDCGLFSKDCVNMWPLMDFDHFLHPQARSTGFDALERTEASR